METKIRLCDSCKKQIKEFDCDICGCDLCSSCRVRDNISFFEGYKLISLFYCSDCNRKIHKLTHTNEMEIGKDLHCVAIFKKDFINGIKKLLIVDGLGDKE
jgi:hypothetical protein